MSMKLNVDSGAVGELSWYGPVTVRFLNSD